MLDLTDGSRAMVPVVKAGRYFLSHRDESVALYMNWLKLSKAIAEDAYTLD